MLRSSSRLLNSASLASSGVMGFLLFGVLAGCVALGSAVGITADDTERDITGEVKPTGEELVSVVTVEVWGEVRPAA